MLTTAFHYNILKKFVDILIKEGNYMTECLKDNKEYNNKENKELIVNDLVSLISHHTLNAICGISVYIYKKLFLDIDI